MSICYEKVIVRLLYLIMAWHWYDTIYLNRTTLKHTFNYTGIKKNYRRTAAKNNNYRQLTDKKKQSEQVIVLREICIK